MQSRTTLFLLLIFSFLSSQVQVRREMSIMHSPSSITIVAKDSATANHFIDVSVTEMQRIENEISEWISTSQISQINANAGIKPVKVTQEIFDFIERSKEISQLTEGAFDISWASVDKIWKFDGTMKQLPTKEEAQKSVQKVNYKNIILDKDNLTVFLKEKGMKIGTGGNGQGFGADKTKELLLKNGITNALLNISGDICTWGTQANGEKWKVGVSNPLNKNKIIAYFQLDNQSFTTSGNYEKFVEFNGKRYSHIIDPRTGFSAQGIASVSVFSHSTELSDALDTAIFVLGKEVGLDLVNQLPDVECIIIDTDNKMYFSKNLKPNEINN